MSRIYEIPYHPDESHSWAVRLDGEVLSRFDSRFDALLSAMKRAAAEGGDTSIGIEGADGVWRPFGSDAKRPARPPPLPSRLLGAVR
ncbi:hypothetical protein J2T07_003389 [Luteibacter jiangsuensis]|uniref:DUF2188 domain-containing protein n=1 Tax=Luteibacter jiangsuensis TaxID=637577 RepID=A0ABT9T1N3_9GAMM|nr:DUF2188 domain-containing protein [Luteibacter jiangsuensis]MDQ0011179.1 hypothetical protein [Luteibacter jiangsuensis]